MAKTRKERKEEAAERVCRELRYQIVVYGLIGDWDKLNKHLSVWMNNSNKNKFDRP